MNKETRQYFRNDIEDSRAYCIRQDEWIQSCLDSIVETNKRIERYKTEQEGLREKIEILERLLANDTTES